MYFAALGAGVLVGAIYALLGVRSPAPPVVALVGLLGILLGEQAVPLVKRLAAGDLVDSAWISRHVQSHTLAQLPCHEPLVRTGPPPDTASHPPQEPGPG